MNVVGLSSLVAGAVALILVERFYPRMALELSFKADLKRETRWLAQYGQTSCTLAIAAVLWLMDRGPRPNGHYPALVLVVSVVAASVAAIILKRLLGRVRPRREGAGKFLGPSLKGGNSRESFPSSHSAAAVAMSVVLARLYPPAAPVFWTLALICAGLRYVMDAHWPSDVLGGIALGYVAADLVWRFMGT